MNIPNQGQPNPGSPPDGSPCIYIQKFLHTSFTRILLGHFWAIIGQFLGHYWAIFVPFGGGFCGPFCCNFLILLNCHPAGFVPSTLLKALIYTDTFDAPDNIPDDDHDRRRRESKRRGRGSRRSRHRSSSSSRSSSRDQLYKDRYSRKINSRRLFTRE